MNRIVLSIVLSFIAQRCLAQGVITVERTLEWAEVPTTIALPGGEQVVLWRFTDGSYSHEFPTLPRFNERFALSGLSDLEVELLDADWEPFDFNGAYELPEFPAISASLEQERALFFARLRLLPYRKTGVRYERMTRFRAAIRVVQKPVPAVQRGGPYTYTSALSSGTVYKFGVSQSGLYKLDYNYLKSELGITDLDNIDPRTIRLMGNGGSMLPELAGASRPDDLVENAILVVGEQDGRFNTGDYILFYAVGPNPWTHQPSTTGPQINVQTNLYDRHAWYFIKTGDGPGARVADRPEVPASYSTEFFDDVQRLEDELVNLLDFAPSSQGSGKRWMGDYFLQTRSRTYDFSFPNASLDSDARIRVDFAGRCQVKTSFRVLAGGRTFSRDLNGVSISNAEATFAWGGSTTGVFQPSSDNIQVVVEYPPVAQYSEGWLDFIELNVRRKLIMVGNSLEFRDLSTLNEPASVFRLSGLNGSPASVWDITNPLSPARQLYRSSGNSLEFGASTQNTLRNYIAFYDNSAFPKPEVKVGRIPNQNLHGLDNVHMVIVHPTEFRTQAAQLANHRRDASGLDVALVDIGELYNEFSSGRKDPVAIRDICRMLYQRNPDKFNYLLLFGDGSFDPKNNTRSGDNLDFVPVFETAESFDPIRAHPSDDFFALLSDWEGGSLDGAMEIAVGRLTVRNSTDAQVMVNKIIDYDVRPSSLGDWRLNAFYVADDEDVNLHINQAEKLANETTAELPMLNIDKIYFDAYQQIATSGGDRIPGAKDAINSSIFKGALVMHYIGHGGPRGWGQERVLDNNDIASWRNTHKCPLIVTATCSFGGYDDYKTLTGGEQALLKDNSGAIALFTTVRAVYISENNRLTDALQKQLYKRKSIGDVFKDAKNVLSGTDEDNARRFTLLGDPAQFLAIPPMRVRTTTVNGKPFNPANPDTIRALQTVSLGGEVTDANGQVLTGFNGRVYVTVFDKPQALQTLGQDNGSIVKSFSVQRNRVFKGLASVRNGLFSVSFVVPKDINYTFGLGKISYYAENGTPLDAAGSDNGLVIGGNAVGIQDDTPPTVQVFLNTDAFAFGGITNSTPVILVKCSDDFGMNVTGAGLGHDLTAVLNGNVQETIVLNDFYQSNLDDALSGQATYPLRGLAPGRHTLLVKGWDVANNSGESYTEFVVADDGKAVLEHVLNYPNPFTTHTSFQFEHNLAGQVLDVQISIFTVSGKLVKTIHHTAMADGFRVADIPWDGRDEFGDALARGVYLYRLQVRGTDPSARQVTAESNIEKLVILR
jgi:hypothetical protein